MSPVTRVGVAVLVVKDGRILVGLRKGSHGANTWGSPGGHLEFGESPEDTARREAMEETGVTLKNVRFAGITNDVLETEQKHYITIWMIADLQDGEARVMEPNKLVEVQWRAFDDLPSPLFLPLQHFVESEHAAAVRRHMLHSAGAVAG